MDPNDPPASSTTDQDSQPPSPSEPREGVLDTTPEQIPAVEVVAPNDDGEVSPPSPLPTDSPELAESTGSSGSAGLPEAEDAERRPSKESATQLDLPPLDEARELRPHDDYISLQRGSSCLVGALILMVLLLATIIVATAGAPGVALKILLPVDLVLCVVIVWVVLQWPKLVRRNFRYRVRAEGVEVQRGLWWLLIRFVPRSRIQHAGLLQGPIERQLGLATVAIHTAGSRTSKTRLSGLGYDEALALVRELTQFQPPDSPHPQTLQPKLPQPTALVEGDDEVGASS